MKMKVKVTCFWKCDADFWEHDIPRFGGGKRFWKNVEFVPGDDYDRLIILTRPHPEHGSYNPAKAITFLTEPTTSNNRRNNLCMHTEVMYLPLPFWPADSLKSPGFRKGSLLFGKNKLLSCITTDLNYMKGHFYRLRMVNLLDQMIEEGLDVYGKQYGDHFFHKLRQYRGTLEEKYDGLWQHKYHFMCENSFENGYFTEKIVDPLVAESLCFYDGCKDLERFIDERAFVRVDVHDPIIAAEQILTAIQRNEYSRRVPYIRRQKDRCLTALNPLNLIWLAVNEKDVLKECLL